MKRKTDTNIEITVWSGSDGFYCHYLQDGCGVTHGPIATYLKALRFAFRNAERRAVVFRRWDLQMGKVAA